MSLWCVYITCKTIGPYTLYSLCICLLACICDYLYVYTLYFLHRSLRCGIYIASVKGLSERGACNEPIVFTAIN